MRLEDRNAAVGLDIVPLLGIDAHESWGEASAALTSLASRLSLPLPSLPAHTQFHAWGSASVDSTPADTMRVYVGPAPPYGLAAPGGYVAPAPLPRSWGGWIGLDLDATTRDGVTARVAKHELLHVFGAEHGPPGTLMSPTASRASPPDVTAADADALELLGVHVDPVSHFPGHSRVFGRGTTSDGWVMVPNDKVAVWFPGATRVPDGDSFGYMP